MTRRRVVTLVLLLGATVFVGLCVAVVLSPFGATLWNDPGPFLRAAGRTQAVRLYEGLPHQMYERESLASERRTKDVFEVAGFPFYRGPMAMPAEDAAAMTRILSARETYHPQNGTTAKFCGGFHPDYAVEFDTEAGTWYVLLCFGCGDIWVVGPNRVMKNDLVGDRPLVAMLKGYVKNRPVARDYPNRWRSADRP